MKACDTFIFSESQAIQVKEGSKFGTSFLFLHFWAIIASRADIHLKISGLKTDLSLQL